MDLLRDRVELYEPGHPHRTHFPALWNLVDDRGLSLYQPDYLGVELCARIRDEETHPEIWKRAKLKRRNDFELWRLGTEDTHYLSASRELLYILDDTHSLTGVELQEKFVDDLVAFEEGRFSVFQDRIIYCANPGTLRDPVAYWRNHLALRATLAAGQLERVRASALTMLFSRNAAQFAADLDRAITGGPFDYGGEDSLVYLLLEEEPDLDEHALRALLSGQELQEVHALVQATLDEDPGVLGRLDSLQRLLHGFVDESYAPKTVK